MMVFWDETPSHRFRMIFWAKSKLKQSRKTDLGVEQSRTTGAFFHLDGNLNFFLEFQRAWQGSNAGQVVQACILTHSISNMYQICLIAHIVHLKRVQNNIAHIVHIARSRGRVAARRLGAASILGAILLQYCGNKSQPWSNFESKCGGSSRESLHFRYLSL